MNKWSPKRNALGEGFVRYVIGFRYNGSYYCGWQSSGEPTVTKPSLCETIGNSLNKFIGPNSYKNLKISSRTDAGVHAIRNVLQVDMCRRKHQQINGELLLPHDIVSVKKGLNFYLGEKFEKMYVTDVTIVESQTTVNNSSVSESNDCDLESLLGDVNENVKSLEMTSIDDMTNRAVIVDGDDDVDDNIDYTDDDDNEFDVRGSATSRKYVYRILCSGVTTSESSSSSSSSASSKNIESTGGSEYSSVISDNISNNIENNVNNNNNNKIKKESFSPRFDDTRRMLFHNDLMWVYKNTLNITLMNEACQYLQGIHDFTSFRARNCQSASSVRDVTELYVTASLVNTSNDSTNANGVQSFSEFFYMEPGAHMITITISANSFLQRMVRNIVGCLVDVGTGRIPTSRVKEILDSQKRGAMMYTQAPAHGLYLVDVVYDENELTARQRSKIAKSGISVEDFILMRNGGNSNSTTKPIEQKTVMNDKNS